MVFPLISAAIGAAGSIGGAFLNKSAADSAAEDQRRIAAQTAAASRQAGQWGADASNKASRQTSTGLKDQISAIDKGFNKSRDYLQQGLGYLEPYAQAGQAGMESYADLLGVNGPEAQARAHEMYQTSPGFQEAVDYGIAQAQQSGASGGRCCSA